MNIIKQPWVSPVKTGRDRKPEEINKNNDCPWFVEKIPTELSINGDLIVNYSITNRQLSFWKRVRNYLGEPVLKFKICK
jgi:hypothetical protein